VIDSLQRHELLCVRPEGWRRALALCPEIAAREHVADWVSRGWPVMVRRFLPADQPELIPVAISLPPSSARSGIALQLLPQDIGQRLPAVPLKECVELAPAPWRQALRSLLDLGERLDAPPAVFGSLLWQKLTGLSYLHECSDLDLIWRVKHSRQALALAHAMAVIAAHSPMALDGEFLLPDGAGVQWREFLDGAQQVIVKTLHRAESRAFETLAC
jgi:phosphoribosyl-dephospho-CoA transferase